MADLKYNFLGDSFTTFENVEIPKVELNFPTLNSPIDISDWATGFSSSGTPIVKDNRPKSYMVVDNSSYIEEALEPREDKEKKEITGKPGSKEYAISFFESKGLQKHQAAGIVGNLIQESNLNTSVIGDKGTSYGIAQWRGDRRTGLTSFAKELGTDISDFKTQLEYVWKELNSSHKSALNKLLKSKNSDEATIAFMRDFERPNEKYANLSARLKYAKSCLS